MEPLGRALIVLGIVSALIGLWILYGPSIPWLGRLPGDIHIERPGFRFSFPIVTCIVLSVLASLLLYAIGKLR